MLYFFQIEHFFRELGIVLIEMRPVIHNDSLQFAGVLLEIEIMLCKVANMPHKELVILLSPVSGSQVQPLLIKLVDEVIVVPGPLFKVLGVEEMACEHIGLLLSAHFVEEVAAREVIERAESHAFGHC